jgi:hypothetical protein
MPGRKKLFFGSTPFRFLALHLAQDEDFLSDARLILELDQDVYSRLVTQLGETDDFLDRRSLAALISKISGEGEEAGKIASIIYRIGGLLHDADMPPQDAMDELGEAIKEKADGIESEDRQILVDRLRALAADPVGLAKQYKARKLVDAIGSELDEFQFICDIRPIFDQDRERIEGAIPLAALRLEYTLPDGGSAVVEVRVSERQLEEFGAKITTAKRKLELIKEFVANQRLPIPRTKSTVTEEE